MSPIQLAWANISYKPLTAVFHVILMAMGVATILTLSHLNRQMDNQFQRDLAGIDLVVSGKGSPLQIILSSVFHLDIPTGNIPVTEAEKLQHNMLVKSSIPLALGDNYNGYRIVGTTADYINHYDGHLATGALFTKKMEVVIGADVAHKYHLQPGDKIVGAHGLVNSDDMHTDFPYTVTGILKPSGSVLDRLVLTPVESVWHVHEHPDEDDPDEVAYKHDHPENEITALLITYKSPLAAATLPRLVNKNSSMQAASPAFEVARLNHLINSGSFLIRALGIVLMGFAGLGVFVTLYNAVNERRYDMVLLRVMGATRSQIGLLLLSETCLVGLLGVASGFFLTWVFTAAATQWIWVSQHIAMQSVAFNGDDIMIGLTAIVLALIAGVIPTLRAYRLDITNTLRRAP